MAWWGDSGCLAVAAAAAAGGDDEIFFVFCGDATDSALAAFVRLAGGFGSRAGERRRTFLDGVVLFVSMRKTGRVVEGEEVLLLGWSDEDCGGGGEAAAAASNGDSTSILLFFLLLTRRRFRLFLLSVSFFLFLCELRENLTVTIRGEEAARGARACVFAPGTLCNFSQVGRGAGAPQSKERPRRKKRAV